MTRRRAYHALPGRSRWSGSPPWRWIVLSAFKTRGPDSRERLRSPLLQRRRCRISLICSERPNFILQFTNSIVDVIDLGSVIAVAVLFLAALTLSRAFKPRGTAPSVLMFLFASVRMLPAPAVILPVFLMYAGFAWKDSHVGLISGSTRCLDTVHRSGA